MTMPNKTPAWLAEERAATGTAAEAPDVDLNQAAPAPAAPVSKASTTDVEEAHARTSSTPSSGINVVDLGLVYGT